MSLLILLCVEVASAPMTRLPDTIIAAAIKEFLIFIDRRIILFDSPETACQHINKNDYYYQCFFDRGDK